ncbi:MAG: transporter substrate-binding domain-containing protein [Coriobacteriales bacterium]
MKRKLVSIALACCMLCFGALMLSACGGNSSSSSAAAGDNAPTDNVFIVGFDQGYPPYGFKDTETGEFTGFDLDLAKEVCDRNGWTFQAEPIDWDAKDALVNQGNITCIWNGFTYEGRENDYSFTDMYMLNAQVIVVKADSGINSLADLAGKTVMTQVDSAALEVLDGDEKSLQDTFAGGKVETIGDYNNAFMQLESGMVDAVACDLSIAQYQMAAKPGIFKMLDEQLSSEHYAVAFKKGNDGLADQVTATLMEMDADGTVKEICEKYSADGISYENWCLGK